MFVKLCSISFARIVIPSLFLGRVQVIERVLGRVRVCIWLTDEDEHREEYTRRVSLRTARISNTSVVGIQDVGEFFID